MNRFAFLIPFTFFSFVFVACDDHKVTLSFNTQNPAPEDYELRSSLRVLVDSPADSSNAQNPESMNADIRVRLHSELLSAYDDGSGRFLLRVDSANYTSDTRSVEESDHIERYLKTQAFQFKMAENGDMKSVSFDDFVALPDIGDVDIRKVFLKIQPVLPSSPIAVGESWERQQVISDDNGKQSIAYKWFKLEDIFMRDGVQLAKVQMNVRYKQRSEDDSQLLESSDFVLGSGSVIFDVKEGKIVEGELSIDGKVRLIEKQSGDTIPDLRVHQKISLRSSR